MRISIFAVVSFVLLLGHLSQAQSDTIVFKNGDRIIGEVKGLDNSVLKIETVYSDKDLTTEWEDVAYIWTNTRFVIDFSSGGRESGRVLTNTEGPGLVFILQDDGQYFSTRMTNLVTMVQADKSAWDRLKILIEGGYSLTKANNVTQLSLRGTVSYLTDRWNYDGNVNIINSTTQDTISSDRRSYGAIVRYFIVNKLFVFGAVDMLESEEQDLDLRTNFITGFGAAFIRTQRMKLSVMLGTSYTNEQYLTADIANLNGVEGYAAFETNIYGLENLSMFGKVHFYPSFTVQDRVRVNLDFNFKYDLPLDFYISAGANLNYDNKPQTGGEKSDYAIQTGLGWEF